ncbi:MULTISPECIES: hypothetical protein [unclassified Bradyrhizobium]|uniref:hypothetical protein n=1 Tax=unclassified Bradyrhizobium TaxID=2631580 RepID=UPI0028E509D0|nr:MULTISPECIES: hypothetical protein [unclassified Bradyrhizobium]
MSTGIMQIKELLGDIPDIGTVTMRYENGGRTEVYSIGSKQVRIPAGTPDAATAIRTALKGN